MVRTAPVCHRHAPEQRVSMTAGLLVLMLWGLPKGPTEPQLHGTLAGQDIAVTLRTHRPVPPGQPLNQRLTSARTPSGPMLTMTAGVTVITDILQGELRRLVPSSR
ncbi:hypothetical protein ACGFNV_03695 [Streptomyces sp. NPDC048751]|uniref:hypothetical protein n=1 Tax=Streptomyces sp. NPDC048751 TaxID=3365591 RepID=UPI00371D116F